jgi:hypothetical protein
MKMTKKYFIYFILSIAIVNINCKNNSGATSANVATDLISLDSTPVKQQAKVRASLDSVDYARRILLLAHDSITGRWPVPDFPYPEKGAILPFYRVISYYGNFYSRHMGILGSLPEDELIANLQKEVELWSKSDTTTPALPAIHYIAITAQSRPGQGKNYRLRMPEKQIYKAINLSRKIKGITFLDIQVGHSSVQAEVPSLENYLKNDDVHLGLDPEWCMKDGTIPGRKIGTMDAKDINFAIQYLSDLVKTHQLKPKILVVHRFTKGMITNSGSIKPTPQVQVVINMDGFGFPAKKVDSYKRAVSAFPVQFTGFKLFYKNDKLTKPYRLMTQDEILKLYPKPIYIQYQ